MAVRKDFSQRELFQAIQGYLKNKTARIARATKAAVEWKFADDLMWSAEPLYDFFGFRGSNKWERAKRKWLASETPGCYRHGFDVQGRLRIAERKNGPTILFEYGKDQIDQMRYAGERSTFLRRFLQEKGVTLVMYQYHLDPHQYSRVDYQYDAGRCVQGVEESWYEQNHEWKHSAVKTTTTAEYEGPQLVRVYEDMGAVSPKKLVFFDKKALANGQSRPKKRRPVIAYTLRSTDTQEIYSDAYGLEMTIDDETPADTIILAPPGVAQTIPESVNLAEMGSVFAGASSPPKKGDYKALKAKRVRWVLLDGNSPNLSQLFSAASNAGMRVILAITDAAQLGNALKSASPSKSDGLVVALSGRKKWTPEKAQAEAELIRAQLRQRKLERCRVIVATRLTGESVMHYLDKPDVDGGLLIGGNYGDTVKILSQILVQS